MNSIKTNDLGFYNDNGIVALSAKQYDTGRKFIFRIVDNDEPFDLTGCNVYLRILKADGTQFQGEECCSISDNTVIVDTSVGNGEQILTSKGINTCELHLTDSQGRTLTTWDFIINVTPRVHNGSHIDSIDSFDVLDNVNEVILSFQASLNQHINNKENPHGVTKEQVGLENVDNTSDKNKPVSMVQQKAIDDAYANSNAYTDEKIAELINGAPTTLDTLKEIADAMTEHESVVEALDESIGKKANQSELDTHTDNDNIHVTTTEKSNWNVAKEHADSVHTITQGGTSATTAREAQYNLMNDIPERTASLNDNDYSAIMLATPSVINGVLAKSKVTLLWDYIKSKISSVLGLTETNYAGTSARAIADANGNSIADTYATQEEVLKKWDSTTSRTANTVLAAPNGSNGAGTFRKLVSADLPTIPSSKGGTGQTSLVNSANALINALTTGASAPTDNDYFVSQYSGGGATTTTYHRKPVSALWSYIKDKADSVYLKLSGGTISSENTRALTIERTAKGAANIQFKNSDGALGAVGMNAIDGDIIRYKSDPSATDSYTVLDTGNYKDTVTPANIGAVKRITTTMVELGFTADSTVSVQDFLLALRTAVGTNDAQVDFSWSTANQATVSDGTNSVLIDSGVAYTSGGTSNILINAWSTYTVVYFPRTSGVFYKFNITASGTAKVYSTSMKIYNSIDGNVASATTLSDTLPVDKGGTGATTAKEAEYNLLGGMSETTVALTDGAMAVFKYSTPTATQGVLLYKKVGLFWDYIKGKISSVLGLTATNYGGVAAKATADANGNNIVETYATKQEIVEGGINASDLKVDVDTGEFGTFVLGSGYSNSQPVNYYTSIVYYKNRFFSCGNTGGSGGSIYVSENGLNWSSVKSGVLNFTSLSHVNNKLMATGRIIYNNGVQNILCISDDGDTWEIINSTDIMFNDIYSIAYNNNTYVGVGTGGKIYYSTDDGITWTQVTSNTTGNLRAVVYGSDKFVAVGENANTIYSTDGITWNLSNNSGGYNIIYANNQFHCVYASGITKYSHNGINWSNVNSPYPLSFLTYANNMYIGYYNGRPYVSTDGYIFTTMKNIIALPSTIEEEQNKYMTALCYANGKLLASGKNCIYCSEINNEEKFLESVVNEVYNKKMPYTMVRMCSANWETDGIYSDYGYKYEESIYDYYDSFPEYFLKTLTTNLLPTTDEQSAFNLIGGMRLDVGNMKLIFYASSKPTTDILVVVKGVLK